jgi:hypothetical protein
MLRKIILPFITGGMIFSGCINVNQRSNMTNQLLIHDKSTACSYAVSQTDLSRVATDISAIQTNLSSCAIPFLSRQISPKEIWAIDFDDVTLKLDSAMPEYPDHYANQRKFSAVIDAKTGLIIQVTCTFRGERGNMCPEPSVTSSEKQLQEDKELYCGLPTVKPKITFLKALDIVLSNGGGSPFEAKEIDGLYVMYSRNGSLPKPMWVITLRGLPPITVTGPPGARQRPSIPVWQRNHMRSVIDAMTGQCLFSTNTPHPDQTP